MAAPAQKEIEILKIPPYVRIRDCKLYFSLSKRQMWKLLNSGVIQGSRAGKYWLVRSASVLRYLHNYENNAPDPMGGK